MQGDPRWITTRTKATCAKCKAEIPRGASAFYYPNQGTLYCAADTCGQQAAADFEMHRQDEDGY